MHLHASFEVSIHACIGLVAPPLRILCQAGLCMTAFGHVYDKDRYAELADNLSHSHGVQSH